MFQLDRHPTQLTLMSATDDLVQHAQDRAAKGRPPAAARTPRQHLLIVTCMDSRIDNFDLFGLQVGDAHILRNAGGVVTDDMIRSIAISQRMLGTREIALVHHTDCGMTGVTEDGFKQELERETGVRPEWSVESFTDPASDVRQSMERLRRSPFLLERDQLRGFVYDVDSGELNEVTD
jgi:carbonic anhydrase